VGGAFRSKEIKLFKIDKKIELLLIKALYDGK
jgi:hypothetical protein